MKHKFDPLTYYCFNCGCAKKDAEKFACIGEHSNVTAISHMVRLKQLVKEEKSA